MPPSTSVSDFQSVLDGTISSGRRILALCGAGTAAPSGMPTMRGPGGEWERRGHDRPGADLEAVWACVALRRRLGPRAAPNAAHRALARLGGRAGSQFLCLRLGPGDGLAERAGHPAAALRSSVAAPEGAGEDGDLMVVVCAACRRPQRWGAAEVARACAGLGDAADAPVRLPRCEACGQGLLRPVARPDQAALGDVDAFVAGPAAVGLLLLVGTASVVPPAGRYVDECRGRGAVVAVVNPDPSTSDGLGSGDFFFQGDAAELLPRLLGRFLEDG